MCDSKFPQSIVQRPLLHICMILPPRFSFYLSLAASWGYGSLRLPASFLFSPSLLPRPHLHLAVASWGHSGWCGCCFSSWTTPRTKPASPTDVGCLSWLSFEVKLTRHSCPLGVGLEVGTHAPQRSCFLRSHILRVAHSSAGSLAPTHMRIGLYHTLKGPLLLKI